MQVEEIKIQKEKQGVVCSVGSSLDVGLGVLLEVYNDSTVVRHRVAKN